jgi:hypothetical protein
MTPARPKIRRLDPVPTSHNGAPALYLRDPLRLNGHALLLPQALAPLLFLCDGTRPPEVIARILDQHFGLGIETPLLLEFLAAFDETCLLENERAAHAKARLLAEYRAAPFRPPASAGQSYPDDPAELHRLLQDYLEAAPLEPDPTPGAGLLSPHIDYPRGGAVYAQVWKRAARMVQHADLFLVIGTNHYDCQPVTLTRQNYATPYGVLPTSQPVLDALARALGEAAFAGELFHRTEHSLELPLVWLHHLIGERPVEIVPILIGNLLPADPLVRQVAGALRSAAAAKRVFTVISGDLAHVGPAFGGEPAAPARDIRLADQTLLQHLSAGDREAFLFEILRDDNANNVCGAYPLYMGMHLMGAVTGEAAGYAHCPADGDGASIVSIGGMVFHPNL